MIEFEEIKPYKEKKWFKNDGGEKITTGYSLRGRQRMKPAVVGLLDFLEKGETKHLEDTAFRILDKRKNGIAIDIEVQMVNKNDKGIAMVKLYGPYDKEDKKDNVVMITKSKESNEKFVTILAENIIKPLIFRFVNGETEEEKDPNIKSNKMPNLSSVTVRGKEVKLSKCQFCERTFFTSTGLKVHIGKMHQSKSIQDEEITNEANKIVQLLLKEIVPGDIANDVNEDIEKEKIPLINDITLDENVEKRYEVKCDDCEFVATGSKKYFACQLLQKHKESCHQCDFTSNNKQEMKRHMRDQHEVMTNSTSPPQKRKRREREKKHDESEPMECQENNYEKVEDMEITEDEDFKKKRSDLMDAKVLEKRKLEEEKEKEYAKYTEDLINLKNKEEEKQKKVIKDSNKKRKQIIKDKSKKMNKRIKASEVVKKSKVPNIRNVPENCRHLVNKNDVLYTVPGDGCCGPNSASAHLFKDEVYGPKLRRKMNQFAADHFNHGRYKFIFNCSPENPYIRKLGDGEIKFTVLSELLEFLKTSENGAFMWTENEDLAILSDLYQIRIKIITTKGEDDKNVTENWIYPDPELKQYSELQNVEIDDLILLNESNVHFNLVVSKDSDLAQLGSLSYRYNVGPIIEDNEKEQKSKEPEQIKKSDEEIDYEKELERIKEELKESKKRIYNLESEYTKCEKELKSKTEENTKLKSEIKDLKQILDLRDEVINMNITEGTVQDFEPWESSETKVETVKKRMICDKSFKKNGDNMAHRKTQHDKVEELNCNQCKFKAKSNFDLRKHTEQKHIIKCHDCGENFDKDEDLMDHMRNEHYGHDEEFNCEECDFQTNGASYLRKHIEIKHEIRCKICYNKFDKKEELMYHRKSQHPGAVAQCRNYATVGCDFSADKCWWNHDKKEEIDKTQINCFVCGDMFKSIKDLMVHKKTNHKSIVKACNDFQQNKCRFKSESCWFIHEQTIKNPEKVSKNSTGKPEKQLVFQNNYQNSNPPLLNLMKKQKKE